jgi:predicted small metal-binding protein
MTRRRILSPSTVKKSPTAMCRPSPEETLHARRAGDLTALPSMAVKRINCVCGSVVEGDDDDELWEKAQRHLRDDHPDLAGKVARDDIVAQAEEI